MEETKSFGTFEKAIHHHHPQHCKQLLTEGPWHQHSSRFVPPTSITEEHGTAKQSLGLAGSRQPSSQLCLGCAHPLHSSWLLKPRFISSALQHDGSFPSRLF